MRDPDRDWPGWVEPLRPDDLARARIRREVAGRADPILRRRRRSAVWRTTGSLARLVAPLAAAAGLLFGWVAHRATPSGTGPADGLARVDRPAPVETMVRSSEADDAPPALLTSSSAPSTDVVLEATLRPGGSP